jgi:hypothetical protein
MNGGSRGVGGRMLVAGALALGGVLTFGLALPRAAAQPPATAQPPSPATPRASGESVRPAVPSGQEQNTQVASRRAHEVVSVASIDRAARRVTVQGADGERRTINVPAEVRGFDTLKVGDNVEMDYYESIGISVLAPGTKPTVRERTSGVRTPTPGAMSADRELTVAAEVVSVDPAAGAVSFRGPEGQIRTVTIADPEMQSRVASLKPGQVVQVTHRESIAASIQPTARRSGGQPPASQPPASQPAVPPAQQPADPVTPPLR